MGNACLCASAPKSPVGVSPGSKVAPVHCQTIAPGCPLAPSGVINQEPRVVVVKKRSERFLGRHLPRRPDAASRGLAEVLALPAFLGHCSCLGYRQIGRLAISGAMGKDGVSNVWRAVCEALGREAGLWVPPEAPPKGWRWLFWEHLYPARGKWSDQQQPTAQGFKIKVGARFRPVRHKGGDKRLVLPLHQRLKLLKQGEKLDFWGQQEEGDRGAAGLTAAELAGVVEGEELDPELLEALMEARMLGGCCEQANREARSVVRRKWRAMDSGVTIAEGEHDGQEPEQVLDSGLPGMASAATATANRNHSAAAASNEEYQTVQSKQGARVFSVQDTRVVLFVPGIGIRPFHFSNVLHNTCSQRDVYESSARDSVLAALNGFNACLLCYGQTGSGKTYTAFGPPGVLEAPVGANGCLSPECGIVIRACTELLTAASMQPTGIKMTASLQYVEIYQDECTDLIEGGSVTVVRTSGANNPLHGAAEMTVECIQDVVQLLRQGEARKKFAETAMNNRSSRAHTVLIMHISQYNQSTGGMIKSQLHIVDLAGCEQLKQSKVVGTRKMEAIGINSSLLVLGKCIAALVESRPHVPFLESKLTTLLKSAFGGNSRTTAIITGSMGPEHGGQTCQALGFGERCSMITNTAQFSVASFDGALTTIDEVIQQCEHSMASLQERGKTHLASYTKVSERYQQMKQKRRELVLLKKR